MNRPYNQKQAAALLGISWATLRRYKDCGKAPYHKIGDRIVYTEGDLQEFLDSCAVPAANPVSPREKLEMSKRGAGHENAAEIPF